MNAAAHPLHTQAPEGLREPLQSESAEQSVLGSLLLDNMAWDRVSASLTDRDFLRPDHCLIFAAIGALVSQGQPADVVTVTEHLKRMGQADQVGTEAMVCMAYLNALGASVTSTAHIGHHAEIVRNLARQRAAAAAYSAAEVAVLSGHLRLADIDEHLSQKIAAIVAPSASGLSYVMASDLPDEDLSFDDEIVEGVLCKSTMAVFYGDSNSGKTFAAIDLAAAVGLGIPWLNHKCSRGLVIYLASEAPGSVELRLRAWQRHHRLRASNVVVVQSPINLFDGRADVAAVLKLVKKVEADTGHRATLIIGDTLARIAAGASENTSEDMGVVISNADHIRAATGAAFLWIAHCGKDAAKGMRGWSGTRAFIDTELEVTADEATGLRCLEITKQRDLPTKGQRIGFKLTPLVMGVNQWGTARSTCVVESTNAPAKKAPSKRPSEIAGAITEFLTARGTGCLKGAMAKHFEGRYARPSIYRETAKMVDGGLLIETGGIVALPGKPGTNA